MDSDIKYLLDKIVSSTEDTKRICDDMKRKLQELDLREIRDIVKEIKSRVEIVESKIQK